MHQDYRGGRSNSDHRSAISDRLWPLILLACLVAAGLDALQLWLQGRLGGQDPARWQALVWQGGEWVFLGALTPITVALGRRWPLRGPRLTRNLAVHAAGALLLCIGWAGMGVAARRALGMGWSVPWPAELASWVLTSLPWSVFMYFAVLGCVHAFAYFVEARERETEGARLQARLAEARLSALRTQLHPHFLFNALNAVGVLVRDQRTADAVAMIERLSDVLRQVLKTDPSHETALAEEIGVLEQYLAIEQVRFSDRLRVVFAVDPGVRDALVPRFVLQPLVENALRHGLAARAEAGTIEIGARREGDDLVLTVRDDGVGLETRHSALGRAPAGWVESAPASAEQRVPSAGGLGLANTRERLTTLYGERGRLELAAAPGGGTLATVRIPLRSAAS